MEADEFFRSQWPGLSARLASALGRRGVPTHDRDDVLQETAIRLFRAWGQVDPARPVEPYAYVVALNVWRDHLRRRPGEELVEEMPEVTSTAADDVERMCVIRDELGRVSRAIGLLRPEQRRVLRAVAAEEFGGNLTDGPAPDALRMARMRARRQLRAAIQAASAFVGAAIARLRRGPVVAMTAVSAAFVVAVLTDVGDPDGQHLLPTKPVRPVVAENRSPAVALVPGTPERRTPDRQVTAPVRHRARPPVAKAKTPDYYWIHSGPASVGVIVEVRVNEHRVMVGDGGNGLPVCTELASVPTPVDRLRCRHP